MIMKIIVTESIANEGIQSLIDKGYDLQGKEFVMKTIYDAMTEAIDDIDEKYLIKTAKCFHLPKEDAKRDIRINAEDLVEMKIKSKTLYSSVNI